MIEARVGGRQAKAGPSDKKTGQAGMSGGE